jgi:hypothetical protein
MPPTPPHDEKPWSRVLQVTPPLAILPSTGWPPSLYARIGPPSPINIARKGRTERGERKEKGR